ncbi:hypothetical protein EJ05DRAFT_513363 [Pseudovirgaria hyperparasitica]|uniref:Uncharacterized protein n=1 Tax=Pseudovirgaria hyperparasitica TaxID=470096 RepID=A0A6A6VXT2_9PEZI|nr:uncharacterized protein EJ05DRAFT_513363 [Pseudovirgaria hyperparasitica]KAF2755043.1 hypothetical protein EJ05DRAFT_513363 [Pseudovirgaria hyperparasitica]
MIGWTKRNSLRGADGIRELDRGTIPGGSKGCLLLDRPAYTTRGGCSCCGLHIANCQININASNVVVLITKFVADNVESNGNGKTACSTPPPEPSRNAGSIGPLHSQPVTRIDIVPTAFELRRRTGTEDAISVVPPSGDREHLKHHNPQQHEH